MPLVLLSRDEILADYLLADCPTLARVIASPSEAGSEDALVVDADSFPPPFPAHTVLLIARQPIKTDLPLLLRPLAPRALSDALSGEDAWITLDRTAGSFILRGEATALPPSEFRLLEALLDAAGKVVPRKDLAALFESEGDADGLLTVYAYRLRKKLAPHGIALRTHHKCGYSICKEDQSIC